jgi:NTP pyrophosphatase (non-canonical NTP hydrolase)
MVALTFDRLRAANIERQAEWPGADKLDLTFKGVELGGEVGELLNCIKKLTRERLGLPGSRDSVEHAAEELADIIICCDLLALALGIDLGAAVTSKFDITSAKIGLAVRLGEPSPSMARALRHAWLTEERQRAQLDAERGGVDD